MKSRNGTTRGADTLELGPIHSAFVRSNGPHAKQFVVLIKPMLQLRKGFTFSHVFEACKNKSIPGKELMRLFVAYTDALWRGRRLIINSQYSFPSFKLIKK
jgi:hypothetical protein